MLDKSKHEMFWDDTTQKLNENREAIRQMASSEEARQLMEMLKRQGKVQRAAQAAAAGNPEQLVSMVNELMSTEKGAQLIGQIERQARKAGLQ